MTETDLEEILAGLNAALKVFNDRGPTPVANLTAVEIRLKSLLMVIHSQVAEQLQELRHGPSAPPSSGSHSPWGAFSQPSLPGFPRPLEP